MRVFDFACDFDPTGMFPLPVNELLGKLSGRKKKRKASLTSKLVAKKYPPVFVHGGGHSYTKRIRAEH